MECPACQIENDSTRKFYRECGNRLIDWNKQEIVYTIINNQKIWNVNCGPAVPFRLRRIK